MIIVHTSSCWESHDLSISLQVGWATGPPALIAAVSKAHSFLVFTVPSNLQRAVAHGLDHEASFYWYSQLAHVLLCTCLAGGCFKHVQVMPVCMQITQSEESPDCALMQSTH